MTEVIVLLMLLSWLACTLVMTLRSGANRPEHADRRETRRTTDPPKSLANGDLRDSAMASRP